MAFRTRRDPDAEPNTDTTAAREAALKLLERSRRTRSDLERRLRDKGFAPQAITEVVDRLAEVGLVNDAEYARAFLAGRWGRRPAGWSKLQRELRAKGVDDEAILSGRGLIEQRDGAADELGMARKLLAQVQARYARFEPRVRNQRLYALLARRGFDGDTIRRALSLRDDEAGAED
ncbi:MAG: regulatory protein RecX [Candidatus Eisenbacteria bacterium]